MTLRPLLLLTLALSFCSIVYELVLAQGLSAVLGNSFLRYNVTIGLYLSSLGLGALLCSRRKAGDLLSRLVGVELLLAALGASSPLAIILWDAAAWRLGAALRLAPAGLAQFWLSASLGHLLVLLIGLLSGFELPLLMRLGKTDERDLSNEVLAVDYLGTLLGALAFPLLLLPGLGVLETAAATALLNALCALYLALFFRPGFLRLALCGAAACLPLALLSMGRLVERLALRWYLGG